MSDALAAGSWRRPRTLGDTATMVGAVLADLPRFVTSPLYRGWHRRWGTTPVERTARLPGDELLPDAQYRATRAITIAAPPGAVWPWLVQVGCQRAGWYSDDLLDNLACPSARTIVPELQHLVVGQWVPMSPTPSDATAFKVADFDVDCWLLWRKHDSTWVWSLTARDGDRTRLVTRVHAVYDWRRPWWTLIGVLLMEFGDFAMMRRMLLGIKERAEAEGADASGERSRGVRGPLGDPRWFTDHRPPDCAPFGPVPHTRFARACTWSGTA